MTGQKLVDTRDYAARCLAAMTPAMEAGNYRGALNALRNLFPTPASKCHPNKAQRAARKRQRRATK